MKRVLSVLLTLLMVVPLLSGCGSAAPETPEEGSSSYHEDITTEPPRATEEDPFEGADPLPGDLVIPETVKLEDGTVLGTIVLPACADELLTFAAQELQTHIKLVTGADTPIVSRTGEGYGSFILVTPETLPLVAERFAEDIAWLSDLGSKETGRFGSDGFSIRLADSCVYLIGNTSRGALNGVYDWIEENLGVLWVRADEEIGTLYDPMPEVVAKAADYREKSPFEYRGWHRCWGNAWETPKHELMLSRNKLNTESSPFSVSVLASIGVTRFGFTHNIKNMILESPLYDPEITDYWETNSKGERLTAETSVQINWWSENAARAVAASAIKQAQEESLRYVFICEEDAKGGPCHPDDTEPFEYAPGEFIDPSEENYKSTVAMTFINRVARIVKETLPDVTIATFAYKLIMVPPACSPDDNVLVVFAPIDEDMATPLCSYDIKTKKAITTRVRSYCDFIRTWSDLAPVLDVYNYYGCCRAAAYYERPIWDRIQQDFRDYVKLGISGVTSEGSSDSASWSEWVPNDSMGSSRFWEMNTLTYWLYSKLAWNPEEDVNALIHYFCEKAYKDASPMMEHYYELLKEGWERGNSRTDWAMDIHHFWDAIWYYTYFVEYPRIGSEIVATLQEAWDAADESVRQRLAYVKETVTAYIQPIIDAGNGEPHAE